MSIIRNQLKREYSQIPNEIITDTTISAGAFRVLVYLFSKPDNWNIYNKDICKQLNITEQTLSKYWKQLLASQWLKRERNSPTHKEPGGYTYEIVSLPISVKSMVTVKSIEHSNTKPIKQEGSIVEKDKKLEQLKADVKEAIEYLNSKTGKKYKSNTHGTVMIIQARLNQGYELKDIKTVIDNKCLEWLGTDMSKFLRPETLFNATKFEGYLFQEAPKPKKKGFNYDK